MNNSHLPADEVRFFSSASPAHTARLFAWRGDYYWAVRPDAMPLFEKLFNEGIMEKLIGGNFVVDTERTSLQLPGYGMVLKHQRLPFITYPFEWSAAALKDAALFLLNLDIELSGHGLGLIDLHPWNIVFDGTSPKFLDLGSIVPMSTINAETTSRIFNAYFKYPLKLMRAGQSRVARCLMKDFVQPVSDAEYAFLAKRGAIGRLLNKIRFAGNRLKTLEGVRSDVEGIKLEFGDSFWSTYYKNIAGYDNPTEWPEKQRNVARVIQELNPRTLLDVGSNTGWYSLFAANRNCKVVSFDVDEVCVERLYLTARKKGLSVVPLFMDLRNPSAGYGWGGARYPGAFERLRADCVLALALIHHLVFRQMADFDLIIDTLAKFCNKHLIIEFISREDKYVSQWWTEKYSWYSLDNFLACLRKTFNVTRIFPSNSAARSIIVCSKIDMV